MDAPLHTDCKTLFAAPTTPCNKPHQHSYRIHSLCAAFCWAVATKPPPNENHNLRLPKESIFPSTPARRHVDGTPVLLRHPNKHIFRGAGIRASTSVTRFSAETKHNTINSGPDTDCWKPGSPKYTPSAIILLHVSRRLLRQIKNLGLHSWRML